MCDVKAKLIKWVLSHAATENNLLYEVLTGKFKKKV